MQKPLQIVALERKLDYLLAKFDEQNDLFLQSHLGRYLIILTAGYFEQAIQSALTEFARQRAHSDIVSYVDATLAWEGSINRDKLSRILRRFNSAWFDMIEKTALESEKNAVDSIKELRDQLAHGMDNGTGYGVAKSYHIQVRSYFGRLLEVVP